MISPKLLQLIPENGLILILGQRGAGKTCLAYGLLEALSARPCYVYRFPRPEILPPQIKETDINFPENSVVLIDEAYISFSARDSMNSKNRFMDFLNGLCRQKNLLIIYITQDSSRVDINIIRSVDILLIKRLHKRQVEFERKELKRFLWKAKKEIDRLGDKKQIKSSVYVDCDMIGKTFEGIIRNSNTPPSFWTDDLSKAWKGVDILDKEEHEVETPKKRHKKTVSFGDKVFKIDDKFYVLENGELKEIGGGSM